MTLNLKTTLSAYPKVESIEGVSSQAKVVVPATVQQEVVPDEGVDFLSEVTVLEVTHEIDENIRPENIKKGITILGVTGTYEGEESSESVK